VAFECGNALQAPDTKRFVVDVIAVMFELSARMYRFPRIDVCILVKDTNERPLVRDHITTCSDNFEIGDLVIVKTTDIRSAIGGIDNRHIGPGETPVCAAVDE
jgi:hypothetical protein